MKKTNAEELVKALSMRDAITKLESEIISLRKEMLNNKYRIAALEEVVREFFKIEDCGNDVNFGCCPDCQVWREKTTGLIDHEQDCIFLKARAVLEGK